MFGESNTRASLSLQLIFTCSLVTGSKEFPHQGTSWTWCCQWVLQVHSGLDTHSFLPGSGFCQSSNLPDTRWQVSLMGSSCLVSDIGRRHRGFLAERTKKLSRRSSPARPP